MKTSLLVAVSAVSLMWNGMAQAQASSPVPVNIQLGAEVSAELNDESSQTRGDGASVYRDYLVRLRAGQAIQVDLSSDDFDAYLEVFEAGKTSDAALAFNDDAVGQGMNARLRYVAEQGGDYIIRARTLMGASGGDYDLKVVEAQPHDYPQGRALTMDDAITGSLNLKSAVDEDDNRMAAFSWTARAGDRMALRLESEDFDALLSLGQVGNGRFTELARNDDGADNGGSLDSYLVFTAPSAGDYYIKAQAVSSDSEGRFKLTMEEAPKAAEVRSIRFDESVEGSLNAETGMGLNNQPADQWQFSGREGQRISAILTADDFDAYLELFDAEGQSLATDDDGAGDLNSRLVFSLPKDGVYRLEARSLSDGDGDYELALKAMAPAPAPRAIQYGQTLEGELTPNSAIDDDGHFYNGFVFDGQANQRVQFTVRSGDFDAMSEAGLMASGDAPFEALKSDDDGLQQGTDSRLTFTLPEDGRYEFRALGLEADASGLYSVELIDLGPEPKPGSLLVPSVARGQLTDQDSLTDEGVSYDAYSFKAKGDEALRFTLISADFDAVVEVGEIKSDSFRLAESDDDSLSDRHARLDWTAPRDGTYQVRVRSYAPNSEGTYSLIVERKP